MGSFLSQLWRSTVVGLLLPSLLLGPGATVAPAQTSDPQTFSGEATVLRATVLGNTVVVSDTGALPSSGGSLQASLLTVNVPGLATAEVAHATTIGQGNHSDSEASVANVNLTVAGNTITADLLMASAEAKCSNGAASVTGSADIVGLAVNGQAISVSGQPNQTVNLPLGGQIIINEQSSSVSGNTGKITVNALHVSIPGAADVVVSSAEADITCKAPECTGRDFVTGGGFITGTPSGAKGNFGVGGGIKNDGSLWGHLEYIDHGPNGPKVHGTGVTKYVTLSTNTREIDGTAQVNGQDGFTYRVVVTDNGEPGTNDFFSIQLSNGYSAGGRLGGGNIKIHHPCE
jgi:hypothetical protein